MKKSKQTIFSLTPSDVNAIIAALPLITHCETDSFAQAQRNNVTMTSVINKLTNGNLHFDSNEIRIIWCAVNLARDFRGPGIAELLDISVIDDEWCKELTNNFFVYNNLCLSLQPIIDRLR